MLNDNDLLAENAKTDLKLTKTDENTHVTSEQVLARTKRIEA